MISSELGVDLDARHPLGHRRRLVVRQAERGDADQDQLALEQVRGRPCRRARRPPRRSATDRVARSGATRCRRARWERRGRRRPRPRRPRRRPARRAAAPRWRRGASRPRTTGARRRRRRPRAACGAPRRARARRSGGRGPPRPDRSPRRCAGSPRSAARSGLGSPPMVRRGAWRTGWAGRPGSRSRPATPSTTGRPPSAWARTASLLGRLRELADQVRAHARDELRRGGPARAGRLRASRVDPDRRRARLGRAGPRAGRARSAATATVRADAGSPRRSRR